MRSLRNLMITRYSSLNSEFKLNSKRSNCFCTIVFDSSDFRFCGRGLTLLTTREREREREKKLFWKSFVLNS